jgi:hypothetical protein
MVDHVVDNDFVYLENIEPAGPSEPESTVSGEESEDLQDQEGSQSAAVQDFNAGKEESPWHFFVFVVNATTTSRSSAFCVNRRKPCFPHILHHTPTFENTKVFFQVIK